MNTSQLQKEIITQLSSLPKEAMKEVLDFIQSVKLKKNSKSPSATHSDNLSKSETTHLESEFDNYKTQFPHE